VQIEIEIASDPEDAARRAASAVAAAARAAIAARGRFVCAASGGRSPWVMLRALAREPGVDWKRVHVFQTDERVAPDDHPDRNLARLRECLEEARGATIHAMSVGERDLEEAASAYAAALAGAAGTPPVLDLVHLGLGSDGHTASLVPGDPVIEIRDRDVAPAGPYQGRLRLTLTLPAIDRSRARLFLVTGADKAGALARLMKGDRDIPAGRVRRDGTRVVADSAAAGAAARG